MGGERDSHVVAIEAIIERCTRSSEQQRLAADTIYRVAATLGQQVVERAPHVFGAEKYRAAWRYHIHTGLFLRAESIATSTCPAES